MINRGFRPFHVPFTFRSAIYFMYISRLMTDQDSSASTSAVCSIYYVSTFYLMYIILGLPNARYNLHPMMMGPHLGHIIYL